MKRTYAGIEITLPTTVEFLDYDRAVPIFHAQADELVTEVQLSALGARIGSSWSSVTRCGQVLYKETNGYDIENRSRWMPTRLAVRIGRPCTKCWPELKEQPSLWTKPKPEAKVEQETLA